MAKRNYVIYLDESSKAGTFYSNFYAGALIKAEDRQPISEALAAKKDELNLFSELKWVKVTDQYLEKYLEFTEFFFEYVKSGRIRIRVMFSQNFHKPIGLTKEQQDLGYFILYYQMIKHAFGLKYCNPNALDRVYFQLLFDDVPHSSNKFEAFRSKLSNIPNLRDFEGSQIFIPKHGIAEIDSKSHTILQDLDIVLGAMHFRLNDLHRVKPNGSRRRGRRTIAKEKLYKRINKKIREIQPGFNIGVSTGTRNGYHDRWLQPYRHWLFIPKENRKDFAATKSSAPQVPT